MRRKIAHQEKVSLTKLDERMAANALEQRNIENGIDPSELNEDWDNTPVETEHYDSLEKVKLMAAAADSVRASDIAVLDLRELTIISDYFLICTGKSSIQIRAIADRIEEKLREQGYKKLRVEGYQEATWILLDYGDVVVHAMAEEQRSYYRIEEFWAAAPRVEIDIDVESTELLSSVI